VTNSGLLREEGRGLFSKQQRPCWKQALDSSFSARKINTSLPGLATELPEHEGNLQTTSSLIEMEIGWWRGE